ncbi:O-methyltransferase [Chloroflexota bacterium]
MSNSKSYELVNYSIRLAKSIERKMIVEVCSRLRSFNSLEAYRYIGFGSPYFSDFSLIHRKLGICEMLCIEREAEDLPRFEFNKPFHCISIAPDTSSKILPSLEWSERPTIIWLDYDDSLNENILSDIDVVFSRVVSGSFFIVSVRASASDFGDTPEKRRSKLKQVIGDKVPIDAELNSFSEREFPKLLWRIIDSEISQLITERNAGLGNNIRFEYSQALHFIYRDSVRIITVGGLVFQAGQRTQRDQCDFASLPFIKTGDEPYQIVVPKLTLKEIRALDEQLPDSTPSLSRVPDTDIDAYAKNYRYFPKFVETEL